MFLLIGMFLIIWGLSLLARVIGMRLERAARKRLQAAGRAVPAGRDQEAVLGTRGGTRLAGWSLVLGVVAIAASASLGWILLGRDSPETLGTWTFAAAMTGIFAGVPLVAGWWFDPARGRARCPRCWYDMPGAVPVAGVQFQKVCCPECGGSIGRFGELYRTRRKGGMLWLAGVVGLLIYPVFKGGEMLRWGPRALVPSTLLIAFFESVPREFVLGNGSIGGLASRNPYALVSSTSTIDCLAGRTLWEWQRAWLFRRLEGMRLESTDVETVWRALAMDGSRSWLWVSPERYVRLAESLFDADSERAAEALDVLGSMGPLGGTILPRSEIIAAHASDLDLMMKSPGLDRQVIACRVVESAGAAFDPYLPTLVLLAKLRGQSPHATNMAYEALAGLSMRSDNALKAFIELYQSTGGRGKWRYAAERLREHRKEIAELLDPP